MGKLVQGDIGCAYRDELSLSRRLIGVRLDNQQQVKHEAERAVEAATRDNENDSTKLISR